MADRFTELQKYIEQSSQSIGHQLKSIDSSLIGAFISVILSAFLSKALGILLYWIPVSFFLMWILLIFSFIKSYIFKPRQKLKEQQDIIQEISPISERNIFLITTRLKNAIPAIKSIGIIFLVSFAALVMKSIGIIGQDYSFSIIIPIISSLLFISLPILFNAALSKLERTKTAELKLGCLNVLLTLFYLLIATFALFVLPIWSLIVLSPVYTDELITILPILLVIFLQLITLFTFMNYFSASSVKKEMTIALLNLSKINNRISNLLLNDSTISDDIYNELKEDYFKAKRYEISADDTLLVNFYSLIPNPTYLSKLSVKQ